MNKKIFVGLMIVITFFDCLAELKNYYTGTTYQRVADMKNSSLPETNPFVSVYGELRAAPSIDLISLYFQYNIPTDRLTVTEIGTGSVSQANGMISITASATSDIAAIESKQSANYLPGHEILCMYTAGFPNGGVANTTQWIGIFNANDGFAVGYNGTDFGILHRYNTTDTVISQSNFNLDKLDGTGPSGFILDQTKINIFYIAFGWLGVASIKFHVIREDGLWIPFHIIQTINARTTPTTLNPSLPMRAETKVTTGPASVQIDTASWNTSISGGQLKPNREWNYASASELTISTTWNRPLLLRNKTTFASKTSTASCRLNYVSMAGRNTSNIFTLKLFKNPTISTTPTFTDIDTNFSVVDYATSGITNTITDQGTLVFSTIAYSATSNHIFFIPNNIFINFFPGETILLEFAEYGNGSVNAHYAIGWEEYY